MTPEIMTTHQLPPSQQLDAWRSWFSSVFEVEHHREYEEQGFLAESRHWTMEGFGVSRVRAPSLRALRTKGLVRRNPVDHWVLTLGQHDTSISTAVNALAVPAQTPFLVSLGEDVVSERVADERLHFYLPRDQFRSIAPQLDAARGQILRTGLGHLLADFLRHLAHALPDLPPGELSHVTQAVRAMVGACLAPSPDRLAQGSGQIGAVRMERVRRVVQRHMSSPDLGVSLLCREVGMSRTQIYALLRGEGGVEHYIRRKRLEASHVLLCDGKTQGTIADIALSVGFGDPSQFSRAFRQEFGTTPSEVRAAMGGAHSSDPTDAPGIMVRPLSAYLRGLAPP